MNMLEVIRQGAARPQMPRATHLPCPFCGADPPPAALIAGRFVAGCENENCAANPQVGGTTAEQAWESWNRRA